MNRTEGIRMRRGALIGMIGSFFLLGCKGAVLPSLRLARTTPTPTPVPMNDIVKALDGVLPPEGQRAQFRYLHGVLFKEFTLSPAHDNAEFARQTARDFIGLACASLVNANVYGVSLTIGRSDQTLGIMVYVGMGVARSQSPSKWADPSITPSAFFSLLNDAQAHASPNGSIASLIEVRGAWSY